MNSKTHKANRDILGTQSLIQMFIQELFFHRLHTVTVCAGTEFDWDMNEFNNVIFYSVFHAYFSITKTYFNTFK